MNLRFFAYFISGIDLFVLWYIFGKKIIGNEKLSEEVLKLSKLILLLILLIFISWMVLLMTRIYYLKKSGAINHSTRMKDKKWVMD